MTWLYLSQLLAYGSVVAPLVVLAIGVCRRRRIAEFDAIPLSGLLSLALSFVTALIAVGFGDEQATEMAMNLGITIGVIAVIGGVNAALFASARSKFLADGSASSPLVEDEGKTRAGREDGSSRKVQDCAPTIYQDPGYAKNWSLGDHTGFLSLFLPANSYAYWMSIKFRVSSAALEVEAHSDCLFRPWYGWFLMNATQFHRSASSVARGVVDCRKRGEICVIDAVGNTDTDSDVECSSAAVVNVLPGPDPTVAVLEASGATAFVGQKSLQAISLGTTISGPGATLGASVPAPGGGGGSASLTQPSPTVTAKVVINMPTIAEKTKHLTRPVRYRCLRLEG